MGERWDADVHGMSTVRTTFLMVLFYSASMVNSLYFLKVRQLPGLLEKWLSRTIETKVGEPAFAREGLHPVRLLAYWRMSMKPLVGSSYAKAEKLNTVMSEGTAICVLISGIILVRYSFISFSRRHRASGLEMMRIVFT